MDILQQLLTVNWGELVTAATVISAGVVVGVTQALKYIPVEWTTRFSVWINIVMSFLAALVIQGLPTGDNWVVIVSEWFVIVVAASLGYNLVVKHAVTKPQGNLPADKPV